MTTFADLAIRGSLLVNDGYRTKGSELGPHGYPLLRVAEIGNGSVTPSYGDCVRHEYRKKIGNKLSRAGDVLLTTKGTVGRRAIMPSLPSQFAYSPQLCFFRTLDDSIDNRWLYYWLGGSEFWQQAAGVAQQTDMASYISLRDLRSIAIELPPIAEQRGIAAILGALDDKIESSRRLISAANALADELWESVASASPTRCSIEKLTAAGVLLLSDGYRTRNDQLGESGLPILRVSDVTSDHFAVQPDADRILEALETKYREKVSKVGDVVVTTKGTVGRTALVGPNDVKAVYSPQICFIRSLRRNMLSPAALYRWVRSVDFGSQALQVQHQTDMAAYVRLADFRRFTLPLPDPDAKELTQLESLDPLIAKKRREITTLEAVRDALLPELLSGRIRVPEAVELNA